MKMPKKAQLYKACITVAGTRRLEGNKSVPNQDSYYIEYTEYGNQSGFFALVADGMGGDGCSKSEVASGYIRQSLAEWYHQVREELFSLDNETIKEMLNTEIQSIHKILLQNAQRKGISYGSTLTAVLVLNSRCIIAHVGDSRCYISYRNYIRQLTEDQTVYQYRLKKNEVIPEELVKRAQSTLIQCIGQREVKPRFYSEVLPPEYKILLCTDGFSKRLTEDEMSDIFYSEEALDKRLEKSVSILKARHETDDITAVLINKTFERSE